MKLQLKHDSIYADNIKTKELNFYNEKDPKNLDLCGVDVLLQCTGIFLTQEQNKIFIKNGAKKVIISAPANDDTKTFIYGINHQEYNGEKIISNSSCSANAIVPIFDIFEKNYGIKRASMSMIHSYTAYQKLLDVKHYSKDIRRSRSATQNIIPLESSAAKECAKFFPILKNKLYAKSIRVPVSATTFYDLTIDLNKKCDLNEIKELLKKSKSDILDITEEDLVSTDFIKSPYSATIDLNLTNLQNSDLLRVCAWQDNEYGYAKRLIDLAGVITC
jgi:glyceraldehyde 3-phosphate dehydrogenase